MHGHTRLHEAEVIREVTLEDEHFSALAEFIPHSWPCTKAEEKSCNPIGK